MPSIHANPASFRDPAGRIFEADGRVFRTVSSVFADEYVALRDSGFYRSMADQGLIVPGQELARSDLDLPDAAFVLEHPRLPFVSYPYEWPFSALKAAALLHLEVHLRALEQGVTLSDASAYNIQFRGATAVFVDFLSFRRYRPGEYWTGHQQFCQQYLNPLLLRACLGVPHNGWYRGSLEGIPSDELLRLLPLRRKLGLRPLLHLVLPVRLQTRQARRSLEDLRRIAREPQRRPLPLRSLAGMLRQLHAWIARLEPAASGSTPWTDYSATHTYDRDEMDRKERFVRRFVQATRPSLLLDVGCNDGRFAELALDAGAEYVVGIDSDHGALELAFHRAAKRGVAFTPLYMDAANPSPDQGWAQKERSGLDGRSRPGALLALAAVHHLAIARNAPLRLVVEWLTELAPNGVVEFVRKEDPTVKQMLALREDIFPTYTEEDFGRALAERATVVDTETVSKAGRKLFWYRREGQRAP